MNGDITIRRWLLENGYDEVAEMIQGIMNDWRRRRVKTRRNWWAILAGGKNGRPKAVGGHEFPVLRAAQRRQGLPITKNAISNRRREAYPDMQPQNRWT